MRRSISVLILTALFLLAIPLLAYGFPTDGYDTVTNKIYGESAINFIDDLTDWVRVAGSDAEKDAADYIEATFKDYGYVTEKQEFPAIYYEEKEWNLTIVEPTGANDLNPNALTFTPSGDVTAELVYAGLGYPEDFQDIDVDDKIALIKRGDLTFSDKVANAAQAGAAGAIIFNHSPGNFFGTLEDLAEIPALSISLEEGEYLIDLMQNSSVTVNLFVDAIWEQRISQNVIATKLASRDVGTGHTIIIGGHYDNVSAGVGANDNASGTAVMMEVARVLKDFELNADVKFIAFGAEEIGLEGSKYYVNEMDKDDIKKTRAMINLDMVGVGDELTAGDMKKNDGWLVKYIKRYCKVLDQDVISFEAEESSDHAYFEYAGIPVCFMTWEPDPYYHTAEDTLDKIDPDHLEIVGKVSAAAIYDLANTPPPRSDVETAKVNKDRSFYKGKFRDCK